MSLVNITNVAVLDNPAMMLNPFQFEISYDCHSSLEEDLEWKLIYVGSAEDEQYDQVLENILVGPVIAGSFRFVFQSDAPDPLMIPEEDILGVTALLLTCSYKGEEFIRIGYYVCNEYIDEGEIPSPIPFDKVHRNILDSKPRITRFLIVFDFSPEDSDQFVVNSQPPATDSCLVVSLIPANCGSCKLHSFGAATLPISTC